MSYVVNSLELRLGGFSSWELKVKIDKNIMNFWLTTEDDFVVVNLKIDLLFDSIVL